MSIAQGTAMVDLDPQSFEADQPYAILTVDGRKPKEIDNGVSVTPITDSEHELYLVRAFATDTSGLYEDDAIVETVLANTGSWYHMSNTPEEDYRGMLSEEIVRAHEFTQGEVRDALVVSFLVGAKQPPTEVSIEFGKVETLKNFTYKKFDKSKMYGHERELFGQAAAWILFHQDTAALPIAEETIEDPEAFFQEITQPPRRAEMHAGNINTPIVISANHGVGRFMLDKEAAIYRVFDPDVEVEDEFIGAGAARYSSRPGPHRHLHVDAFCRASAGLRRAEDFINIGLLRAYTEGRVLTDRDRTITKDGVMRLNQLIAVRLYMGKTPDQDHWFKVPKHLMTDPT